MVGSGTGQHSIYAWYDIGPVLYPTYTGNAVVFEEIGGRTTAVVPSVQKKLTSAAAAGSKRGKRSSSMAETEETDTKTAEVKASKKRRAAEAAESLTATPKVPVEVVDDSKGATGRRRRRGD